MSDAAKATADGEGDRKALMPSIPKISGISKTSVHSGWQVPIAPWGRVEVFVSGGFSLALAALLAWFAPWAALLPLPLVSFVCWFFRDPPRVSPTDPGLVLAPADGLVTHLGEGVRVDERDGHGLAEHVGNGPFVKISIYLSLWDVHVNRAPIAARVVDVRRRPGKFRRSWPIRSTQENEQCWTVLQGQEAPYPRVLVKQVAGAAARRIVNVAPIGGGLARGDKFGMIKLGSRTDLLLSVAAGLEILVRPGDRVRGGETPVARYHTSATQS